jgi:hypothetical protein
MMQMTRAIVLGTALALAAASAASAQTATEPARAFVNVGGGYQFADQSATISGTFTLYDETGTFEGTRSFGKGAFFDVGGGVHVFGQMSAGISWSRYVKASDVLFTVVVPHPLYVNQPRTVGMNVNDLGHTEDFINFQLFYQIMTLASGRMDVSLFGGPSVVMVSEDTVQTVTATETGSPYTAVKLDATFESASKTTVGYNVGAQVNYRLAGNFGAGAFFRYTGGTATLPWGDVKAGGPQVGASLRYTF